VGRGGQRQQRVEAQALMLHDRPDATRAAALTAPGAAPY
jgi:hypothetical protein